MADDVEQRHDSIVLPKEVDTKRIEQQSRS